MSLENRLVRETCHYTFFVSSSFVCVHILSKKKTNQTLKKYLASEIKSEFMFAKQERAVLVGSGV